MLDIKDDKTNTQAYEMTGKCPFGGDRIGGSLGTPPTLSDWYPDRLKVELLHRNGPQADPLGDDFDYAEAFNTIDFAALKQDIKAFPDLLGCVVAVRLRQLRPPDDPHGVARGRYLSYRRWARRRRRGTATLRADQQLVGQRQHRQVAPPDLADQAKIRELRSPGAI